MIKNKPLQAFIQTFLDSFKIAFSELHEKGDILAYDKFLQDIQSPLREYLNRNLKKTQDYFDPYFTINRTDLKWLLSDAREAKKQAHFLTANHRYLLQKIDDINEKQLIQHNIDWKAKIEAHKFTGKESIDEVNTLIGPFKIVKKEREQRRLSLNYNKKITKNGNKLLFERDNYEADERWEIDTGKMINEYRKAAIAK